MVSSTPLATSKSTNTLSYAERAKKGHIAKTSKAASSQHPTASENHSISSITTAHSIVASTSSTEMTGSNGSKASSPLSSVDLNPGDQQELPPQLKGSGELSGAKHGAGVVGSGESSSSAHQQSPPAKPPPVNVWNVRKEQRAQALAQSGSAQVSAPSAPSVHTNGASPSYPPLSQSSGQTPASASTSQHPHVNGTLSNTRDVDDDPFIVKPRNRPPPPTLSSNIPSSVVDAESWPEVGKSNQTALQDEKSDEEKRPGESPQPVTPRKGEKPKWVPIPAEELQAAADAQRPPRNRYGQSHSRNQPSSYHSRQSLGRNNNNNNTQASASASTSGSIPASQGQSRAHSTRGSASQSQIPSLASSVQSSPRQNARGKRLPDEPTGVSGYGVPLNVERVLSGGPSPHIEIPVQYPPQIAPYNSSQASGNNSPGYFPHMSLPVQSGPSPHSHLYPLPNSSPHNPYTVPGPNGFPPQPGVVSPVYPGSPPYSMYQPYMYSYGQPYPYWNGNTPGQEQMQMYTGSSQVSPIPPMQDPAQAQTQVRSGANAEPGAPPPTSMVYPLPPGESEAVAGYREVGPVEVQAETSGGQQFSQRGRNQREVVFGSIMSKSPSPALVPQANISNVQDTEKHSIKVGEEVSGREQAGQNDAEEEVKSFKTIAIGVSPGEPVPSTRSRTHSSSKGRKRVETAPGRIMSDVPRKTEKNKDGNESHKDEVSEVEFKVIDLTDPETKWEFGSTMKTDPDEAFLAPPKLTPSLPLSVSALLPQLSQPSPMRAPEAIPAAVSMSAGLSTSSTSPATSTVGLPSGSGIAPGAYPYQPDPTALQQEYSTEIDDWEVKDYGYGFGPMSGTGYAPTITRDERLARERIRQIERNRSDGREFNRPRRGSSSYGTGYGFERGRRGRGGPRGYGRGYESRGGFSRGGGMQPPRQPPSFTVTPPSHFQQLPPQADYTQYYVPPVPSYGPLPGYEGYHGASHSPPIHIPHVIPPPPPPVSTLSFPLDPLRQSLLGQLEYYLSPQNMAQDFFLRQRMDSLGWISIHLLASFNRVRQLTSDVDLVKDVLLLSSSIEVRDDWVRMGGEQWNHFVLPDATKSHFEGEVPASLPVFQGEQSVSSNTSSPEERKSTDIEVEGEEEEEEEVVFVMGQGTEGPWVSDRRPS